MSQVSCFRKFSLSLILAFFFCFAFWGCNPNQLHPVTSNKATCEGLIFEVYPYTPAMHQQYNYDPLFYELNFNTAFIIKITNLNDNPYKTSFADSFVLVDALHEQYKALKDPLFFWRNEIEKNENDAANFNKYKDPDIEIQYMLNQEFSTGNIEYYKAQLTDLKKKVYYLEKQQIAKDELTRRENYLSSKIEQFRFKDQIIYPQSTYQGLVIFPPLPRERLLNCSFLFMIPRDKVISFSYSIQASSN